MNSIIGLFRANRKSNYFLEAIWDDLISFSRIRFGRGPGGRPARIWRWSWDSNFTLLRWFGFWLKLWLRLTHTLSLLSRYFERFIVQTFIFWVWVLIAKMLAHGQLVLIPSLQWKEFLHVDVIFSVQMRFEVRWKKHYLPSRKWSLLSSDPSGIRQNKTTLGASSKFNEGGVQEDTVDLLISNELSADTFLSS